MELVNPSIHHQVSILEAVAHPEAEEAVRPEVEEVDYLEVEEAVRLEAEEVAHPGERTISVVCRVIETIALFGARTLMASIGLMAISQSLPIGAIG